MIAPLWLYIAAGLCALTWAIHTFVGGKETMPPLRASDLPAMAIYGNFLTWHIATILLALMVLACLAPLGRADLWPLALGVSVLSLMIALWSFALNFIARKHVFFMPQWILFLPIAITSFIGIRGAI